MKNVISDQLITSNNPALLAAIMAQHKDRISQLKSKQTSTPIRKRDPIHTEWATVSHPEYTLLIYPSDDIQFTAWQLPASEQLPFSPEADAAIVYLFRPFVHGTEVEITMNDNVHWVDGNRFVAAASVRGILYKDIMLSESGIIIPVIVEPFHHNCAPFSFDQLQKFAREYSSRELESEMGKSLLDVEGFGTCAQPMFDDTGYNLLFYIDEDYHMQMTD